MAMAAQAIGELQAIQLTVKTAAKQLLPFPVYLKKTYSLSGFIFKILSTVMLAFKETLSLSERLSQPMKTY